MQSDQLSTRLLQQRPMTEPVEALYTVPPSSAAIAAALLRYYSFELAGQTVEEQVHRWQANYPEAWLTLAITEALYQGRYKAISVEQILNLWKRRDQPICHFNGEFERLVCSKLPRDVASPVAPTAIAAPVPTPQPPLSYRRMLLELPSLQAASKLERLNRIPSIPSLKEALAATDLQSLLTDPVEVLGQLTQVENGVATPHQNGAMPPATQGAEGLNGGAGMPGGDRNGTAMNGANSAVGPPPTPTSPEAKLQAVEPVTASSHSPPEPPLPEGERADSVTLLDPQRGATTGNSPPAAIAPLQVQGYVNPIAAKLAKVQLPIIPPNPPQPPLTTSSATIPPAIAPSHTVARPRLSVDLPAAAASFPAPQATPVPAPAPVPPCTEPEAEFKEFKQGVVFALSSGLASPGLSPQLRWVVHQVWPWDWARFCTTQAQIDSYRAIAPPSDFHDKLKTIVQPEAPATPGADPDSVE